jgi:hypothetical protein
MTANEIRWRDHLAGWALMGRLRHAHGNHCLLQPDAGQSCTLGELPPEVYTHAYEDADRILAASGAPGPSPARSRPR